MSNTWLCDGCGKEFMNKEYAINHEIKCPEFKAKKEKEDEVAEAAKTALELKAKRDKKVAEEVANLNILRNMSKEEITEAVVKQKEIVTQKENDVKVRAKILKIANELGKEGRKEQKTSQKELTIESNILKTERTRLTVVQDISSEIFIASEEAAKLKVQGDKEAAKFKAQRDKEAAKLKAQRDKREAQLKTQRDKEAKQAALIKAYTDKQKAELKVHSYSWMDSAQRFPYHTLYISLIQLIAFLVLIVFIIFGLFLLDESSYLALASFAYGAIMFFFIILSSEVIRLILDFHDSNYTNTKVRIETLKVLEDISKSLKK